MIVGRQKPLEEIWDLVSVYGKVLVFGCNTCVAVCHQGGNKEAELVASMLRTRATTEGASMEVRSGGIERQCEHEFFASAEADIEWADAVLSLACGVGVQFLVKRYPVLPVYPGLDTCFLGDVEKAGVFTESCQACGKCILGLTGGICPVARCAKRLFNGPCGGSNRGSCEINKELPCAWHLIVDRLDALGRLDDYEKLASIKDWSTERAGGPRKLVNEEFVA
ncbi:MAG: methylenetetrahydrofolate reductase C-terminal domain-containing protein [Deltaproteobacteria bacterium]|nr:methylenetetrahydrofolate reductase C-terminal domain-containing protein [Deltaproteobacteria bacterium]